MVLTGRGKGVGLFRIGTLVLFHVFLHIQRDMLGARLQSGDVKDMSPGNNLRHFINCCYSELEMD